MDSLANFIVRSGTSKTTLQTKLTISPDHLTTLEVPASTWAVFESIGPFPDTLQNVWGRIYSEWFPSSNYEQAEGPEILWNADKDVTSPTFKSEIWILVSKKK